MKNFTQYMRDSAGNAALLLGIAALPLMLGAGVAVDMARVNHARTILQGAADVAALVGASSKDKSEDTLNKAMRDYLEANNANSVLEFVTDIDQNLDVDKGTFTVKIAGTFPGSFMSLVGLKDVTVDALSVANVGSQSLELVLVLDNTGSMAGSKITNLKTSANTLIDIIQTETSDNAVVKMAVVPFAEYVNVGAVHAGQAWLDTSFAGGGAWEGCVGTRAAPDNLSIASSGGSYPALSGVPCNSPILPLTENIAAVKSAVNAMTAEGWTYIPGGLLWGWNVLDSAAPFTEGKTKAENQRVKGKKAIVLMTDGENTRSVNYPFHDGGDVALANTTLEESCRAVKADGIEIFTVSFMIATTTVKDIMENCATTPSQYFDADNAVELSAAFTEIARDLAAVRLTQ